MKEGRRGKQQRTKGNNNNNSHKKRHTSDGISASSSAHNDATSSQNSGILSSIGKFLDSLDDLDLLLICRNCAWLVFTHYYLLVAYKIRLISLHEFGMVIHEYDPYFNFRAAEYLYENGWQKFFTWFDYKVWYPLGRPVGTTIYPGMQFTAVWIKKYLIDQEIYIVGISPLLQWMARYVHEGIISRHSSGVNIGGGEIMSLSDVCCFIPAWFGVIASFLTGLIAYECTLTQNCHTTIFHVLSRRLSSNHNGEDIALVPLKFQNNFLNWWRRKNKNTRNGNDQEREKRRKARLYKDAEQQIRNHLAKRAAEDDRLKLQSSSFTKEWVEKLAKTYMEKEGKKRLDVGTADSNVGDDITNGDYNPAVECAIFAMGIMGMVPAHLMRSVGGGFDNESIATSAMLLTFYFWIRSLRAGDASSHRFGILAGLAYFYMASTWGGHIFALNLIAMHAIVLVLLGRFSMKAYLSYTLFYIVGTVSAMQIPVIGMAPLKSLEQIGALAVFFLYQIIYMCESTIVRRKLKGTKALEYRFHVATMTFVLSVSAVSFFMKSNYLRPVSARVMGLFMKHTKTGNPLVDSVAEHQPADGSAYFRYLQHLCTAGPIGFLMTLLYFGDGPSFLITYAVAAYVLSHKMVRLLLLMGPIASILGGITVGRIVSWVFCEICDESGFIYEEEKSNIEDQSNSNSKSTKTVETKTNKKIGKKKRLKHAGKGDEVNKSALIIRNIAAFILLGIVMLFSSSFQSYCLRTSRVLSNPTIVEIGHSTDGHLVKVDDYREAYWWLRDNTREDARILSWWDYGYQIASLSNRTTIADGNTWNHEHIALLGKILTTNEDEGYSIARHLADYVLVWTGGGGDDLAKSPHLARIASSIYPSMCPGDEKCRDFGFVDQKRTPSAMMQESLLFKLHSHETDPKVKANPRYFKEVFMSKYGKVRIFQILGVDKESKRWVADPRNRICDVEGGWQCRGQYPPALKSVLNEMVNFQNQAIEKQQSDDSIQHQDAENVDAPQRTIATPSDNDNDTAKREQLLEMEKKIMNNVWEDTEETTKLWKIVTSGDTKDLKDILDVTPVLAHIRSSDGRGPMFWAFEHRRHDMVQLLRKYGVDHNDRDGAGKSPIDLLDSQN